MLDKMTIKQIDEKISEIEYLAKRLNCQGDSKVHEAIYTLANMKTDELLEATINYKSSLEKIRKYFNAFNEDYLCDPEKEISEENVLITPASFNLFKQIVECKNIMVNNFENANIRYEAEAYEEYRSILQKVSVYNQYFKASFAEEEAKKRADENKLKCLLNEILS